ncbi:MAG: peptidoglycan bridge formation glycyltransferase FemA/FemB family protein, partial [Clostridia bacterium]|nr:peptidoglycan bridge formation glycyltransferase FemA/FemB family protein [Clostridia bacterium]
MFEIVTQETLPLFEAFIEGHPKGHFLQSKQWAPVKPDWTWEGILSRDEEGNVRGAMSVFIRKMPGVPYKLMYAARGPVCDLDDRDAMKDLTNGAAVLAKKNNAYALRIDPDVPSDQTGFIELMKSLGYAHHPGDKDFNGIQPCYVFRLNVKDKTEEELLAAFHSKTRYNLRLSARKGVT